MAGSYNSVTNMWIGVLLIVDMTEEQLFSTGSSRLPMISQADRIVKNIRKLSEVFDKDHTIDSHLWIRPEDNSTLTVLFPRVGRAGSSGAELVKELRSIDRVFMKKLQYSAFWHTDLSSYLHSLRYLSKTAEAPRSIAEEKEGLAGESSTNSSNRSSCKNSSSSNTSTLNEGKALSNWTTKGECSVPLPHVYMTGINTDYCILLSAIDAFYEGFKVTLVEDATGSIGGPSAHARGVEDFRKLFMNGEKEWGEVKTTEEVLSEVKQQRRKLEKIYTQ